METNMKTSHTTFCGVLKIQKINKIRGLIITILLLGVLEILITYSDVTRTDKNAKTLQDIRNPLLPTVVAPPAAILPSGTQGARVQASLHTREIKTAPDYTELSDTGSTNTGLGLPAKDTKRNTTSSIAGGTPAIVSPFPFRANYSRISTCNGCFKHTSKFISTGKHICEGTSRIDVVFLITTAPNHASRRNVLRETWLSNVNATSQARYAFLLGATTHRTLAKLLQEEMDTYRDIIMEDFEDTYLNLTYKTVMGMRWVGEYCPNAKYVMKTDDDIFVFVPRLLKLLESRNIRDKMEGNIMGSCSTSWKPVRNPKSKYVASLASYPNKTYPPLCAGTGYMMSMRTANRVYNISKNVPFFHLEDVYVGMCLQQLGIHTLNYEGFASSVLDVKQTCRYENKQFAIAVHVIEVRDLGRIWDGTVCKKSSLFNNASFYKRLSQNGHASNKTARHFVRTGRHKKSLNREYRVNPYKKSYEGVSRLRKLPYGRTI